MGLIETGVFGKDNQVSFKIYIWSNSQEVGVSFPSYIIFVGGGNVSNFYLDWEIFEMLKKNNYKLSTKLL